MAQCSERRMTHLSLMDATRCEVQSQMFWLLGDKTRLAILNLLAANHEMTSKSIASHFAISNAAISQHLTHLRERGLVEFRPDAQRRMYRMDPVPIQKLSSILGLLAAEAVASEEHSASARRASEGGDSHALAPELIDNQDLANQ